MVLLCDKEFSENEKYQEYFDMVASGFELSDFQKWAVKAIVEGEHILITAHTGSGKTLPAELAILYFVAKGKRVIYTAPIKALSNTKLADLRRKYPHISFGIITGDITDNPEADVLIMTTEILPNTLTNQQLRKEAGKQTVPLSFEMDIENDLAAVVFDEVHYINDRDRGGVWENAIMMLPPHVQMIMLSATIDKPEGLAGWVESNKAIQAREVGLEPKTVYLAPTSHRVVPLTHYMWLTTHKSVPKKCKGTKYETKIPEYVDKPIVLKDADGTFNDRNYHAVADIANHLRQNRWWVKRQHVLDGLVRYLKANEGLPAICFVFSRKHVELAAKEIGFSLFDEDCDTPSIIEKECRKILATRLQNYTEYLNLPEYRDMIALLQKGIGIHHAGILPVFREMTEILFEKRMIKLLFATETLAVGINFSTTSVIYTGVSKFDGHGMRLLQPSEYTQISGRAGRRGIDKVGKVWLCANLFDMESVTSFRHMLTGPPQTLVSKFKISFALGLNICASSLKGESLVKYANRSMMTKDIEKEVAGYDETIGELKESVERKHHDVHNARTPFDTLMDLHDKKSRVNLVSNKQRKKLYREISAIEEGNKFIKQDMEKLAAWQKAEEDLARVSGYREGADSYINSCVDRTIQLLNKTGFVVRNHDGIVITDTGLMAGQFQEIHPLAMAQLLADTDYFDSLGAVELAGLFACFANVSVSDEYKLHKPSTSSHTLNTVTCQLDDLLDRFYDHEVAERLETGSSYERCFDLQQATMNWCNAADESACRDVLNDLSHSSGIFLGEFVKSLLKINNVAAEIERAAETMQRIDLMEKVRQIPAMTLKYVATNQSLYV